MPPLHIQVISASDCKSVGDVLREIDSKRLIHGDFVLIWGDTVSNVNLAAAMEEFKRKRENDKNVIMTMILKEALPKHRTRERGEGGVFVLNKNTNECLAYEPLQSERPNALVEFDLNIFTKNVNVDIRYDLLDCEIDICSLDVLALYTENFDYQKTRADFLRGVLSSEILGSKVFCHLLQSEYAARVRSTHLYDSVSKDVITRWSWPLVPDTNFLDLDFAYKLKRNCIYIADNVTLARSVKIGENVVLGLNSILDSNVKISNSVVGKNCVIGPNCVIENSYLWDNVRIEENCVISHSILADNVTVRPKVVINRGSIVSFNVILGPDVSIPAYSKITKVDVNATFEIDNLSIDDDEEIKDKVWQSQDILGIESNAYLFEEATCCSDDESLVEDLVKARQFASDYSKIYLAESEEEEFSEDDSEFEDGDEQLDLIRLRVSECFQEAQETLRNAISSNYTVDNAVLELNALKFACNASFKDCRAVIVPILMGLIEPLNILLSIQKSLGKWARLLTKFTHSEEEQVELLKLIQEYLAHNREILKSVTYLLPLLYKIDVLDEEAILLWWKNEIENKTADFESELRNEGKGFIEWLKAESTDDE